MYNVIIKMFFINIYLGLKIKLNLFSMLFNYKFDGTKCFECFWKFNVKLTWIGMLIDFRLCFYFIKEVLFHNEINYKLCIGKKEYNFFCVRITQKYKLWFS